MTSRMISIKGPKGIMAIPVSPKLIIDLKPIAKVFGISINTPKGISLKDALVATSDYVNLNEFLYRLNTEAVAKKEIDEKHKLQHQVNVLKVAVNDNSEDEYLADIDELKQQTGQLQQEMMDREKRFNDMCTVMNADNAHQLMIAMDNLQDALNERDGVIADRALIVADRDNIRADRDNIRDERNTLQGQKDALDVNIARIQNSLRLAEADNTSKDATINDLRRDLQNSKLARDAIDINLKRANKSLSKMTFSRDKLQTNIVNQQRAYNERSVNKDNNHRTEDANAQHYLKTITSIIDNNPKMNARQRLIFLRSLMKSQYNFNTGFREILQPDFIKLPKLTNFKSPKIYFVGDMTPETNNRSFMIYWDVKDKTRSTFGLYFKFRFTLQGLQIFYDGITSSIGLKSYTTLEHLDKPIKMTINCRGNSNAPMIIDDVRKNATYDYYRVCIKYINPLMDETIAPNVKITFDDEFITTKTINSPLPNCTYNTLLLNLAKTLKAPASIIYNIESFELPEAFKHGYGDDVLKYAYNETSGIIIAYLLRECKLITCNAEAAGPFKGAGFRDIPKDEQCRIIDKVLTFAILLLCVIVLIVVVIHVVQKYKHSRTSHIKSYSYY